ncbi:MAG TPA: AAA family ATPase [Bryobacteraceae bacterium]|nr:AAA family ATPase [Bryobacteraceae bacterium]
MSELFWVPQPPDFRIPWNDLEDRFPWIEAMRTCPQDPIHHAEGDVWTHVRMVCESLAAMEAWRALPPAGREVVWASALLHDVAKPACTRWEDGRVKSPGHSRRGSIDARRILWEAGMDFAAREQVCGMIRFHQAPFHLINRADAQKLAFRISQSASCRQVALLAAADASGRTCADQAALLDQIALFEEYCREQECLETPRRFPSNHSRFLYFRSEARDPNYLAYDDSRCEVTLLAGLPGSGKDTWIAERMSDLPVISLDEIREELGAAPSGNQGAVLHAARETARGYLRQSCDFVWNATNLGREVRRQLVDLFTAYHARVRIVYVEAIPERLFEQNRNRTRPVNEAALLHMMERWEVPDVTEGDRVEWWVNGEKRQ